MKLNLSILLFSSSFLLNSCHILNNNERVVDAGKVYGSAEIGYGELEKEFREGNIKSVIDLRTSGSAYEGFANYFNIRIPSKQLPEEYQLRDLERALEYIEINDLYPLRIMCSHGADRTSIAAALYLMLIFYLAWAFSVRNRQIS